MAEEGAQGRLGGRAAVDSFQQPLHWFSLFQLVKLLYWILARALGGGQGGLLMYWKDKAAIARVGVAWPGLHSCERRQDQLPQTLCSFLSTRGLVVELRQVPPVKQDICFALGNGPCNTHCFCVGLS